ncbi:MAG: L-alanine exporter AlaE [Promethearchaeota archaeon]
MKHHLVDGTALLAESTPVFAAFEVGLAGMSDEVSLNARLFAAGLTYFGGMGYAYAKGRDLYRRFLHITDKTKERKQTINDAIYTGLFNLIVAPIIYVASGARDIKEIAIGTASAVAFGAVNGIPMGYSVDTFRDLTGLKECDRPSYPKLLKKQNSKVKKGLATLLVGTSVALTAGIYGLTPDEENEINQEPVKEVIAYNPRKESLEGKTFYIKKSNN